MRTPHRRWASDDTEPQTDTTIRDAYRAVFQTPQGKLVLDDLWRRVNEPSVDYKQLDESVCVYRVARIDLFRDLLRMTEPKEKTLTHGVDYP